MRWFWDREEDGPLPGMSRRKFLFLGLGAAAGALVTPYLPKISLPVWSEYSDLVGYNDLIEAALLRYEPTLVCLYNADSSMYKLLMEQHYETGGENIEKLLPYRKHVQFTVG